MEMFSRLGLGWRCSPGWGWDGDVLQAGPGVEMFSRTEVFPGMELA